MPNMVILFNVQSNCNWPVLARPRKPAKPSRPQLQWRCKLSRRGRLASLDGFCLRRRLGARRGRRILATVAIRGGVLGGDNRISGSHHLTARSAESAIERYSQLSCERPTAQSKGLTGQCENHFVNQLQLAAQDLAAHINVRNTTWGPQGMVPGSARSMPCGPHSEPQTTSSNSSSQEKSGASRPACC